MPSSFSPADNVERTSQCHQMQLRIRQGQSQNDQQAVQQAKVDQTIISSKRSGGYKCNKCLKPKVNHVCQFQNEVRYVTEVATQTSFSDDDEYTDDIVPNKVSSLHSTKGVMEKGCRTINQSSN